MNAIPRPLRESADQRRERHAAYFRELAEMNMDAARVAHAAVKQARDADKSTHEPTLDLARATRGVALAANAENDLFRAERAPRPPASDTRRPLLCRALLQAAKAEPDPARRADLNRDIPALDLATLPDELIGMEARTYIRDG